jgi:hypothetical protein
MPPLLTMALPRKNPIRFREQDPSKPKTAAPNIIDVLLLLPASTANALVKSVGRLRLCHLLIAEYAAPTKDQSNGAKIVLPVTPQ